MDLGFDSNVDGDFRQNDEWSEGSLPYLFAIPPGQYPLCSRFQDTFDIAFSDTTTQTTPFPISDPANQVKQEVLPVRDACDTAIIYTPACSSGQDMTPFQDGNPSRQETAATDDWCKPYRFSGTDEGSLSPATNFDAIHLSVGMNGGRGHTRPTSPSQVVKLSNRPDMTSNWIWSHTWERPKEEGLEKSWSSQRDRFLMERHDHASGWPCPICNQRLKRRDYIKPHVKRKHRERYDELYCTRSSTPERLLAAPANRPSTHNDLLASGCLYSDEKAPPLVFWDAQFSIHTQDSFQSEFAFQGEEITPQKRSLNNISRDDWGILDRSDNEPSSRLKTSHDNWTRSLACPFYKHYPFQHRKCLSLSLRRPKDVKQHIYRSHIKPEFYCAWCYEIFHSATERDTHWREGLCNRSDSPTLRHFQGITEDQRKLLSEKSPRELDIEGQWFQIYGIIFPGAELPRSAYVGNDLEEIVPLLREKWEKQGYKITARAVGDLGHHQLSRAMDLFFRSLEGEAVEHETDDNSICARPTQSQTEDNSQWCTCSILAM